MARSPVPNEVWKQAEEAYRNAPPRQGTAEAQRVLHEHGFRLRPGTVVQHMTQNGIKGPGLRLAERRAAGGRTEARVVIPPRDGEMRVVFLGDQQCSEHDVAAHRVVCAFLRWFLGGYKGHKLIVLMGDGMNMTRLGRFDYDPDTPLIEQEIEDYRFLLEDYAKASGPGTEWLACEGNHEWRLWRVIQRDPSLKTLIAPWPELLEFNRIFGAGNWQWVPYGGGFAELPGPLLVHHGYRVSSHSAYAAKLHLESTGMSVIHGHTHRLGSYYKTFFDRTLRAFENGSLCVPQSYTTMANWQSGFSYGRWDGERYTISQVEIIDGRAFVEGQWFGVVE